MFQITEEEITEEILNQFIPQKIKLKEKLIRKINESYQYNTETYRDVEKGDYNFISKLLEAHIFLYC